MSGGDLDVSAVILLRLYDCSAKHGGLTWSFESAFRACNLIVSADVRNDVFEKLVQKGFIIADGGFAPYDVDTSINGPDLSGETTVQLSPRGVAAALAILEAKEPKSYKQRLHGMNWATWGGIAAIVAAAASSLGAVFSYLAIK